MALAPAVTALIEPAITGARFERHNLLLGILVIPGVALVVGGIPRVDAPGLLGGRHLGGARRAVQRAQQALPGPSRCDGRDLGSSLVRDSCWSPQLRHSRPRMARASFCLRSRTGRGWLVLAILCTLIPFAVSLATLRHLSAFTAQLAINLEPVYAIAHRGAVPRRGARARWVVLPGRGHRAGCRFRPRMAANAVDRSTASVCMIRLIYI